MQELPDQLRRIVLQHVDAEEFQPYYDQLIKVPVAPKSVMEEMLGSPSYRIDFTGHEPYALKFYELKKIVTRVKERVFHPEDEMRKILEKTMKALKKQSSHPYN